jgi:hypothetical protein
MAPELRMNMSSSRFQKQRRLHRGNLGQILESYLSSLALFNNLGISLGSSRSDY